MTNFDIAQKEIQTLNSLLNYNAEEMWDEITEHLYQSYYQSRSYTSDSFQGNNYI